MSEETVNCRNNKCSYFDEKMTYNCARCKENDDEPFMCEDMNISEEKELSKKCRECTEKIHKYNMIENKILLEEIQSNFNVIMDDWINKLDSSKHNN